MITGLFVLLSLLSFSAHARRIITVDDSVPFWTENEEPKEIEMSMPGGIGKEIVADESIQAIVTKVLLMISSPHLFTYSGYLIICYKTSYLLLMYSSIVLLALFSLVSAEG